MNSNNRASLSLVKLAIGALAAASLALVLFVLPAEFDIDPTGLGESMGIKGMSGYQVGALTTQSGAVYQDRSSFWLAPFESVEFKYTLAEGQSMVFDWRANAFGNSRCDLRNAQRSGCRSRTVRDLRVKPRR